MRRLSGEEDESRGAGRITLNVVTVRPLFYLLMLLFFQFGFLRARVAGSGFFFFLFFFRWLVLLGRIVYVYGPDRNKKKTGLYIFRE